MKFFKWDGRLQEEHQELRIFLKHGNYAAQKCRKEKGNLCLDGITRKFNENGQRDRLEFITLCIFLNGVFGEGEE